MYKYSSNCKLVLGWSVLLLPGLLARWLRVLLTVRIFFTYVVRGWYEGGNECLFPPATPPGFEVVRKRGCLRLVQSSRYEYSYTALQDT